ncbi:Protein tyrosine/serine phosphatase [Streptoalloteichus tenebrarius]|uniref:Protein tyrosine/serine phosphatase n=1 Tax=Streptoalloteichus tenebrarius (strain ATCC 17920 / DSM 40477 / JCM 4838 / CBS 697.72 / NBRC 16177 / NCIMB 11028 / NRRL B-12390 / A12253. 1 / ISP 5477) TaxID=1933 RepID=A0ABT1HMV8_STRSD|nr:tyrosine-protein phosphatase [Streptoalloteichus tenebrarius]MCP2256828.1 Protein tyrosine/serine phosphatase [Streptoalloteichus tenebrarius]BFF00264.1 tyrosine-protein phosphatase [Streptoalloteichus tenebrarius]
MTATDAQPVQRPDRMVNLRDLGGLPTEDGRRTRPGVLYRGDAPHAGDVAPEHLPVWPPRVVVDLRARVEYDGVPHPLERDPVRVHRVPLLDDLAAAPQPTPVTVPSLTAIYTHLLSECGADLAKVLGILAAAEGPSLVHCSAGKDRTGVAVALLLRTVGVRRDAVIADYVLTDANMPGVMRRMIGNPMLPPGVDPQAVRELMSAPAAAIEVVLDHVDEHPGGVRGWLVEHGADEADLDRWTARFLG